METATLEARMTSPAFVLPGAMDALTALHKSIQRSRLPAKTLELVNLRASQINGCGVCVDEHPRIAPSRPARPTSGSSPSRPGATRRTSPRPNAPRSPSPRRSRGSAIGAEPVPDAIWEEAARHYDETALAGLVLAIAAINVWNRLNVTTQQVAGREW